MSRPALVAAVAIAVLAAASATPARGGQPEPASLSAAIDRLSSLDYRTRTDAARLIRRLPAGEVIPALTEAASKHNDGYVRFRALVLLTGFNEPRTVELMTRLVADPNDRVRQVAYTFFEHTPTAAVMRPLVAALETEESEFVRPSLVRALAAMGGEPVVRDALVIEVDRGVDFFRSVVIEALGDYRAGFAVTPLLRIVRLDGPLQDDAAVALGKIRDRRALETLASLQRTAPRDVQPSLAAAICLLGVNCSGHQTFLEDTLRFAIDNTGYQPLLRAAANGLAALAADGNASALSMLLRTGMASSDPARAAIALAVGSVAIRNTDLVLDTLGRTSDTQGAALLLRDAFDMLEEDFEEERFFARVRQTYWKAAESSPARSVAQAIIETLEF